MQSHLYFYLHKISRKSFSNFNSSKIKNWHVKSEFFSFWKNTKKNQINKVFSSNSKEYSEKSLRKCFAVHILEFEILQITWKKWIKEYQTLAVVSFSPLGLAFWFFLWFARFQILISEPHSIFRKLLALSWLYWHLFHFLVNSSSTSYSQPI